MINRRRVVAGSTASAAALAVMTSQAIAQHLQTVSYQPSAPNPASDWTDAVLYAVKKVNIAPPEASRYLAIAHMAGFAAMNGIVGRYEDSLGVGRGPIGADAFVAFHVAAEAALDLTMPGSFGGLKRNKLRAVPSSTAKSAAIKWGTHVGKKIGAQRASDGAESIKNTPRYDVYGAGDDPMKWALTSGETNPIPILPGWGRVAPFGVHRIKSHRADPFPHPSSEAFWGDVKLIKAVGGTHSTLRRPDHEHLAHFWEDGPHSVTPPGHFLQIARQLFEGRLDAVDFARAMALTSMALADAGLSAWDSKYAYDILRPETAIRGRMTQIAGYSQHQVKVDPQWSAIIPNPRFPAYVSGHSTFGAAGARMMQLINGSDRARLALRSPDDHLQPRHHQGKTRYFSSIWETAVENGLSRIYGGVHWTFDHDGGMTSGKSIADEIFSRHFRPVGY